jgi:hypothetical protein
VNATLESITRSASGGLHGCDDGAPVDHSAAPAAAHEGESATRGHRPYTANRAQLRRDEFAPATIRGQRRRNDIAWGRHTASRAPARFGCLHSSVAHGTSFASRERSTWRHVSPPRAATRRQTPPQTPMNRLIRQLAARHTRGLHTTGCPFIRNSRANRGFAPLIV